MFGEHRDGAGAGIGGAMVVAGRPQEPLRSQEDARAMHLLSWLMRRLIIDHSRAAGRDRSPPVEAPARPAAQAGWRGPVRSCSENDTNRALAPLLSQRGNAGMLVVQAGLPALPQSECSIRRITHPSSCIASEPKLANSMGNRQKRPFWRFYYVQQDPTNRWILRKPRPIRTQPYEIKDDRCGQAAMQR